MTDIVRIPFHGDEVLVVEHQGKPHILLRPVIEHLGLNYSTQLEKLRAKSWAKPVMLRGTQVGDQAQRRDQVAVDVRTMVMLLATVDERRVSDEARPKLVAYQAEVADVIDSYFTLGGAINPRATSDQLIVIADRAASQARVLRLLDGIVDPAWLEAKARHVAARALGEEPEVDHQSRPLTVGEFLGDKGVTGVALRSLSSNFGKAVKRLYVARHGKNPPKVDRFIDGALRPVAGYTEAHRPLFEAAWDSLITEEAS